MKKVFSVFLLTFFIFSVLVGVTSAAEIKDVTPSHWAYKSVKLLVDKGYFSLYEDSTFRGDRNVTRYQLAEIVAKILANLGTGSVTASEGDIKTIRELAVELRKELVEVVQNQQIFSADLSQLKDNQIVIKEDIARSQQQILEIIDQLIMLKELEEKYLQAEEEREKIKEQIKILEEEMAKGLSANLNDVNTKVAEINKTSKENEKAIAILKAENEKLKADIEDLKVKNSRMLYYIIGGVLIAILIK